jgi:hypothetical protein
MSENTVATLTVTRFLAVILGLTLVLAVACYAFAVTFRITRIPFGLIETTMGITTSLDERALTVTGKTSLPDGALIDCEVWHESEDSGFGTGVYEVDQASVVSSGAFVCRADLTGWPAGIVRAHARFVPYEDQPIDVAQRYGEYGERLTGPGVFHDSDGWILDVQENVQLSGIGALGSVWR